MKTITDDQLRTEPSVARQEQRLLEWAATFFAVAVLLHNGDHLRRGTDAISSDVFWVGSAAILLEVGVVVLVFLRHRLAPLAAAVTGFNLAIGYVVVHLLPERGWLSDPLFDGGASVLSQSAALLEIAAAVTLGSVGLTVLRRRGGLASAMQPSPIGQRELSAALTHPVVAAMIAGNAIILVLSLADL